MESNFNILQSSPYLLKNNNTVSSILSLLKPSVYPIAPGANPTTLIFFGPNSTAKCLVNASTPALAVPA